MLPKGEVKGRSPQGEGDERRRKEHARTRVTRLPENVREAVPLPANPRPSDDHSPGQGWTVTVGLSRHFGRPIPRPGEGRVCPVSEAGVISVAGRNLNHVPRSGWLRRIESVEVDRSRAGCSHC